MKILWIIIASMCWIAIITIFPLFYRFAHVLGNGYLAPEIMITMAYTVLVIIMTLITSEIK